MRKLKLLLALCSMLMGASSLYAETDYTSLMPSTWTNTGADFQGGRERYQGSNFESGKIIYQSFQAPVAGIYEIKFYAVTSSTSGRGFNNIFGNNIAQAYASAGSNKTTLAMTVIDQTGCTLVADANIRTLSVEAAAGETIEYGLENIATGGNWYTIKELSAKMKTVAEIFQSQYDEAYAIWENSTENEDGARATFKSAVDALGTALNGTLAEAQAASDALATALTTYESKSYPVKGSGVKYDFTSKMNMAINAWTCAQGNGPAQYGFTGATETYGNTNAGEVMYQTITRLPNGEYEIHFYAVANAANGGGVGGTKATVYANDQELEIDVITQSSCTPSDYERTFTVMVKDGTLKYGIKNTVTAGNWYICKNVALYMTGAPDLSDYYEAIAEKLATANGLKTSAMNATVLAALQDVIDATSGYESITVINTLETMSDNLTTAINNANTSVANYEAALAILNAASSLDADGQAIYAANTTVVALQAAYNDRTLVEVTAEQSAECAAAISNYDAWTTLKAYADALVAAANDNATANTTLGEAISTQTTAVSEATTAAAIATATSTLKAAMITYAGAANPTGSAQFDLTFMMTNPDVSGFANGAKPAGWYCEYSGTAWHNPAVNRNATLTKDGKTYDATYEFWTEKAIDTNEFTVCQKVTLPVGTYTMSCLAFADANNVAGATNNQVYFYANDTQGSKIVSPTNTLAEASISFVNATEQEVKIGLKALTGNEFRWMGIGYVELYKVPAKAYTVDEIVAWDNTVSGAGDVNLKRTIKAGVNTLVLPFSMTQAEVEANFGTGSKVYAISAYNATTENISFTTKSGISANEPCLLQATQAGTEYTLEGRTIVAGEPVASGTGVTMTGTYAASVTVPTGNYIISGGKLYNVDSDVTLKNTRAYITVEAAGARALTFSLDGGETTGIATLENGELKVETGVIYDLSGRAVKNPAKGIYVINGKKVVK